MNKFFVINLMAVLLIFLSCSEETEQAQNADCDKSSYDSTLSVSHGCAGCPSATQHAALFVQQEKKSGNAMITFIELGSVNCVPCKQMQPVMKAVEGKYGDQIEVVFYDVWKADQKKYAQQYGIRLIPTQVFLDKNGVEIFRHEGFLPEAEIDHLLQQYGLQPNKK